MFRGNSVPSSTGAHPSQPVRFIGVYPVHHLGGNIWFVCTSLRVRLPVDEKGRVGKIEPRFTLEVRPLGTVFSVVKKFEGAPTQLESTRGSLGARSHFFMESRMKSQCPAEKENH